MGKKNTGGVVSSPAHVSSIADFDAETDWKYSAIQAELANVQEHPYETGTYRVDVSRFLNGLPAENEIILLHATSNGTLLRDSAPIIPNKRYRIRSCSEKIKNGDIFQVRLLVRCLTTMADELR